MRRPHRRLPQAAQSIQFSCPLCSGSHAAYAFGANDIKIYRCADCALTFSGPQFHVPKPVENGAVITLPKPVPGEKAHASLIATLEEAQIAGPVLVVADPDDGLVGLLERSGIEVGRIVGHNDFGPANWGSSYDAAIVSSTLMRVTDPRAALTKIRRHLSEDAKLVLSLPLLDGYQARLMGRKWHEWHAPNLWFFTRETLNLLLLAAGFEKIWFHTVRRHYSLDYLIQRLRHAHEGSFWFRVLNGLHRIFPKRFRTSEFPLPAGTSVTLAKTASAKTTTVVSIVVPVFNESGTFKELFEALLAKQLPDIKKEIIVVESNSTDGSRELVRAYENHPDVRVIYQPAPRGKGNAVREGLLAATGDILMIQDADLEYDLDDYDNLLAPLLAHQSMFILGSRHQGDWKIREFADAPMTAAMFNLGHSIFRTMINLAVNTKMVDPFTMYKVFRRDALFGIDFVCNRFDFDIELVIKLIRKGYIPIELPVNYTSRSFAEGKKVSVVRDGMTWVATIIRARFSTLGSGKA